MSLQQVDTYSPIASPRKQTAGETLVSEVVIKQCPNRIQCVCVCFFPHLSLFQQLQQCVSALASLFTLNIAFFSDS